jgi:hypothetical protein
MYDSLWLIIGNCDELDKFHSFFLLRTRMQRVHHICKECVDSVSNWLRGVHKKWWELIPSERSAQSEGATKCQRTRTKKRKECGNNFFWINPLIWFCRDPRNTRSAWETKIIKGTNLIRDSTFISEEEIQETGIVGGENFEAFEHLENILCRRRSKAHEEERQQSSDLLWEEIWVVESHVQIGGSWRRK